MPRALLYSLMAVLGASAGVAWMVLDRVGGRHPIGGSGECPDMHSMACLVDPGSFAPLWVIITCATAAGFAAVLTTHGLVRLHSRVRA